MKQNLKEWHKIVCSRANYKCQVCGKDYDYASAFQGSVNQYVCGHHIKTRGAFPELALDVKNGICVDITCHNKIHTGEITL